MSLLSFQLRIKIAMKQIKEQDMECGINYCATYTNKHSGERFYEMVFLNAEGICALQICKQVIGKIFILGQKNTYQTI